MKPRFCVSLALLALSASFTGCVSGSMSPTAPVADRQIAIANAVEDTLAIGMVPVLVNNPDYIEVAAGVSAALSSFSGETITPMQVQAFLSQTKLKPEDARAIAAIVNTTWDTFSRRYAQQVTANVRPDVKLFISAVRQGLNRALAAVPQAQ